MWQGKERKTTGQGQQIMQNKQKT